MNYEFNESGVCINPTVIYSSIGLFGHKFEGYLIKIAEFGGKFIYGLRSTGGQCMGHGSPCAKMGEKFKDKESCIDSAVSVLLNNARISLEKDIDLNNSKKDKKHAQRFIDNYGNGNQLSLFEKVIKQA